MAEWKIVEPTNADALEVIRNLRTRDAEEAEAGGISGARAVWRSYRQSLYRRVIKVNGRVGAIWGLGSQTLSDVGVLWMLTTPEIEKVPFTFVREGKREVDRMLEIYPALSGVVHCKYASAMKYLSILGFSLHVGDPFYSFSVRR